MSGSYNTNAITGGGVTKALQFSWSLSSQDAVAATSTISWTLKGITGSGWVYGQNFSQTVNGVTKRSATKVEVRVGYTALSGTAVIAHNKTTGAGSFSASTGAELYYYGKPNSVGSGSWNLPTIDRAAPTAKTSLASSSTTAVTVRVTSNTSALKAVQFQKNSEAWVVYGAQNATTKNHTYSGLTPNTTYKFNTWVQKSSNNLSAYGGSISVTTPRVAPTAASLSMSAHASTSITGTASVTAGTNSPITEYRFNQGSGWSGWQSSNVYKFSSLTPNTSYTFSVQGRSGTLEGPVGTAGATTLGAAPAKPSISATAIGTTSITINGWAAAGTNSPVTGYRFHKDSWLSWGTATSSTFSGLTPNTSYTFHTQARSGAVESASTSIVATTARVAPGKPSLSFSGVTTSAITANASSTAGTNSPVTGYRFSRGAGWSGWQTGKSFQFTGLASNTNYSIGVQSESGGVLSPETWITQKTDSTFPTIGSTRTSAVKTTSVHTEAIGVSAQAGAKDYEHLRNGVVIVRNSLGAYTHTGLTPFTSYTFQTRVYDNKNRSATSVAVSAETLAAPISAATLSVSNITQTSVTLTASATAQSGIKDYRFSTDNGATWTGVQSGSTISLSSLSPGVSYTFRTRVADREGNTTDATRVARTLYATPVVSGAKASAITPHAATITYNWSSQGPVKSFGYRLNGGSWVVKTTTSPTSFVLSGLAPNTDNKIEIYVENIDGIKNTSYGVVNFRTLEDKWAWLSINGGAFVKVNIYTITSAGVMKKVEKSRRHII